MAIEERIYLGKVQDDCKAKDIAGRTLYLTRHQWACEWYWSFGHIGNMCIHTHFNHQILQQGLFNIDDVFSETSLTQRDWYIICDLFTQAYSLDASYATYLRNHANICGHSETRLLESEHRGIMIDHLREDLTLVLNNVWDFCVKATKR